MALPYRRLNDCQPFEELEICSSKLLISNNLQEVGIIWPR
jgi:hypothetical protein